MAQISRVQILQLLKETFLEYSVEFSKESLQSLSNEILERDGQVSENFPRWINENWEKIHNEEEKYLQIQEKRGGGPALDTLARAIGRKNFKEYQTHINSTRNPKPHQKPQHGGYFPAWRYNLKARYIPGIFSLSPIVLGLASYYVSHPNEFGIYFWLILVLLVPLTLVLSGVVAARGREIQKQYFPQPLGNPTQYFLLKDHPKSLPPKIQSDFRAAVKKRFKENIPPEDGQNTLEVANSIRGQIIEAIEICRPNPLVFSANVSFGLIRNLRPAAEIALILTLPLIGVGIGFGEYPLITSQIAVMVIALPLLILHKKLTISAAERYAQLLISTFITQNK